MSYCQCGGYLGSGGIDAYAGRWCKCANPVVDNRPVVTTNQVIIDSDKILTSDGTELHEMRPQNIIIPDHGFKYENITLAEIETLRAEIKSLKGENASLKRELKTAHTVNADLSVRVREQFDKLSNLMTSHHLIVDKLLDIIKGKQQ